MNRNPEEKTAPAGEALEDAVVGIIAAALRESKLRQDIRARTLAEDEAIEQVLLSPRVRRKLQNVASAYVEEQALAVIRLVLGQALEEQQWACKLVLEISGAAEAMRTALASVPEEAGEVAYASDLERRLVANVRELLTGAGSEAGSAVHEIPPTP